MFIPTTLCARPPNPNTHQVADIWEEGARQVSEQYGIPKYVTDYKDLIASSDVDAVLICSPTDQVRTTTSC